MSRKYGAACDELRPGYSESSCSAARNPTPSTVRQYFECVKGCTASFLNGFACGTATEVRQCRLTSA